MMGNILMAALTYYAGAALVFKPSEDGGRHCCAIQKKEGERLWQYQVIKRLEN
jgi:hypothetical protein